MFLDTDYMRETLKNKVGSTALVKDSPLRTHERAGSRMAFTFHVNSSDLREMGST